MNTITIWLIILLVLTSPIWGIGLYVWIEMKIEERRCPACRGLTDCITAIGPDLQALCYYHRTRRRIVERKEQEVLGEWPTLR